jgi:hypothetical protein
MPIGPIAAGRRRSSGGDPYWSNVTLLVGANGTNGATTFVDESPVGATLTRVGNTQISTAQSMFGGSSALFDGTGDAITLADAPGAHFSTGQLTMEMFVRFATAPTNAGFISRWDGVSPSAQSWAFYLSSSTLRFRFWDGFGSSGGGTLRDTDSAWSPSANTWYHVAATRDGSGIVRTFVDGGLKGKATFAQAMWDGTTTTDIGRVNGFSQFDLNGYADEVRITKGVARYASDAGFTVPTAAYPRS